MWIAAQNYGDIFRIWVHDAEGVRSAEMKPGEEGAAPDLICALLAPYAVPGTVTPVVCSGVQSGLFVQVPCAVPLLREIASADARFALHVLPSISQDQPLDLLQGEEAQIGGFMAENPEWDGVLCLPGAATRWVHISAGEVVSFRSFMTGEIFDLLRAKSSLRSAMAGEGWDNAVFVQTVSDALSRPERFASDLFGIQAAALLRRGETQAAARLMGVLIGVELAAARPYWLGQNVAVLGAAPLSGYYSAALGAQGVKAAVFDGVQLALTGLRNAYAQAGGRSVR